MVQRTLAPLAAKLELSPRFPEQLPEVTATYARTFIRRAEAILREREVAEVFFFATEGLHRQLPPTNILLKRRRILIDQFVDD
jgi:hypothetical protein